MSGYGVTYTVREVRYNLGSSSTSIPRAIITLEGFYFPRENRSRVEFAGRPSFGLDSSKNTAYLSLDQPTFEALTGLKWDSTEQGLEALKKDLEGRTFETPFDLGRKSRPLVVPKKREK